MPFTAQYPGVNPQPFSVNSENSGLNQMLARRDKLKEEEKSRSRQTNALATLAVESKILTPEAANAMSFEQLDGTMRGKVLADERARQKLQDDALARNLQETYQKKQADAGFNQAVQNHLVEQDGKPPDPSTIYGFAMQAGKNPAEINQIFEGLKHGGFIPEQKGINELDVKTLGVPSDMPGMPEDVWVPTSTHGGQVVSRGGKGKKASQGNFRPAINKVTQETIPGLYYDIDTGETVKMVENPLADISKGSGKDAAKEQPPWEGWGPAFERWAKKLRILH